MNREVISSLQGYLSIMVPNVYSVARVPNLPITYFPLNILSVNAVLHKPRPFSEKNGFGTGQVFLRAPAHDLACYLVR
jgi:hypothetical protein